MEVKGPQSTVPTILLAQEDAQTRENFSALILDFFPTTKIQPIPSWDELEPTLAAATPVSILLTDVLWQEADRSDEIILLAEKYTGTATAFFGRYDLTGSLPAGCPIPLLLPDEELPLRLAEWMENLSGSLPPQLVSAQQTNCRVVATQPTGNLHHSNAHRLSDLFTVDSKLQKTIG